MKNGRPTKLTLEFIDQFAAEVQDGLPICYVCDLLGVTEVSYHNWMNQGKQDYEEDVESLHAEFFSKIKKAYAQFVKQSKNDMKDKTKNWTAIAWWLERTNSFFMPKQQIQADEDGKVQVIIGGKEKQTKKFDK